MMYIDGDMIIKISAVVAAIIALFTIVYNVIKWFQKQEKQSDDIDSLNEEMFIFSEAMLACLDGLMQVGANGKVTEAHAKLEDHLNQRAHGKTNNHDMKGA